jgi:Putative transmembrane protein (PGPGW)
MDGSTHSPRAHQILTRVEDWSRRGPVRAVVVKVGVSIVGPLVVAAGLAMLVLPGPGLVVMALGAALLALEYAWARRLLGACGLALVRLRRAVFPEGASTTRRMLGTALTLGFLAATTVTTGAFAAYVGTTLA